MLNVTLLGVGIMGTGMARSLLRAGFPLTVYNRTRAKAEPLATQGARLAATPREAVAGADVVLAMVGDDQASRAIWLGDDGALAGVQPNAVLVECSTLSPAWVRELAGLVAARGLAFLDSPVTGSKDAAEAGELRLLIGGDPLALEQARPALDAISQRIVHLGPAGSGAIMKLINNQMIAVQSVALAEGLVLAERAGLDMQQVVPVLINGAPGSPIVKGKAARMAARDYSDPQFTLRWMHKDAGYALRAAEDLGVSLPTVAAAHQVFQQARDMGLDDADFAAVAEALRR